MYKRQFLNSVSPTLSGDDILKSTSVLKLALISGPIVLFTSQISVKCAAAMMLMCMPALLLCTILTLPALLFESPQQNAYYYFAKVLEQDPTRWLVLLLTGLCVLLSLALPAAMETPRQSHGY